MNAMEFDEVALQKVREDRLLIDELDRWLYDEIRPFFGQRVLDVGCGLGNFARHLTAKDLYIGTDVSPASVAAVNKTYGAYPNMHAQVANATDPRFRKFKRFEIDTVFSLNVFEHIDDHETALENVAYVLKPGGVLILVVPAHKWLYGSIDRSIGHYRRYDMTLLAEMFREVGINCVKLKYINALGAVGWFANGRVRRQDTPPSGQLKLFNKLVPLIRRFESLVPVPFGISLLAVARKGSSLAPELNGKS
ncbi:MAG: class I SAM-dependent methyltransferase [Chloroflexota bacterium]|nr:class I SAM-dependent methyltransferase [Chloroflexota bacterium]